MARNIIDVAIIGGGPGGLGTATALSELPFVRVKLYEQSPEPREIGAGLTIGTNAWNVLKLLGAAGGVRGGSIVGTLHRNGRTGDVVRSRWKDPDSEAPVKHGVSEYGPIRARRRRLQRALLDVVPDGILEYNKKVTMIEDPGQDKGIVRRTIFPYHTLEPTGNTAFRTLIAADSIKDLSFPGTTAWWYLDSGHLYSTHVDDETEQDRPIELTIRSYYKSADPDRSAIWAVPASNERVMARCTNYFPKVREVLSRAPEGSWSEFAMVAGPCLRDIIAWDKVALIGDTSHPLSGAFGAGAAFATEDGWLLSRALRFTASLSEERPLKEALNIFQEIRGPYYEKMFEYLARRGEVMRALEDRQIAGIDELIRARVELMGSTDNGRLDWIYKHNILERGKLGSRSMRLDTGKRRRSRLSSKLRKCQQWQ